MKITKQFLKKNGACRDGYDYVCDNDYIGLEAVDFINKLISDKEKKAIENLYKENSLQWANWLITKVMTKQQCIQYAVCTAKQVLPLYEKEYPNDKRPRRAIEAASNYLKNPTKENAHAADAAYAAANAAAYAANAAYAAYAADAAYAANAADAAYAAYAAYAAADAAYAANAADAADAAYAANAADAAYAAYAAAAADKLRIKILKYGCKLLK